MERARSRALGGYVERHHIVPRCIGGTDADDNIAVLTPEEHYVAHQLLVKINPDSYSLLWAASSMTVASGRQGGRRNKLYGWLRRRLAAEGRRRFRGKKMSPEFCRKMSEVQRGKKRGPHKPETKAKMSVASKGRKKSAEHVAAMAAAKRGKKRQPHSAETRRKMSEGHRLAWLSRDKSYFSDPAYKATQAEKMRAVWAARKREAS